MNIAVYCSSRSDLEERYIMAATALGEWIGRNGHTLVYGGSNAGTMHTLAQAAHDAGASITGVIPQCFAKRADTLVDTLIPTTDLAERKSRMIALADLFVVLPGGIGTLDELSQIMALQHLHMKACSCFILNLCGFYDPILKQFEDWIKLGFIDSKDLKRELHIIKNIAEFERRLDSIAMD